MSLPSTVNVCSQSITLRARAISTCVHNYLLSWLRATISTNGHNRVILRTTISMCVQYLQRSIRRDYCAQYYKFSSRRRSMWRCRLKMLYAEVCAKAITFVSVEIMIYSFSVCMDETTQVSLKRLGVTKLSHFNVTLLKQLFLTGYILGNAFTQIFLLCLCSLVLIDVVHIFFLKILKIIFKN